MENTIENNNQKTNIESTDFIPKLNDEQKELIIYALRQKGAREKGGRNSVIARKRGKTEKEWSRYMARMAILGWEKRRKIAY